MLKNKVSLVQSQHREFRVTHILHNLLCCKKCPKKKRNSGEKFSKRKYESHHNYLKNWIKLIFTKCEVKSISIVQRIGHPGGCINYYTNVGDGGDSGAWRALLLSYFRENQSACSSIKANFACDICDGTETATIRSRLGFTIDLERLPPATIVVLPILQLKPPTSYSLTTPKKAEHRFHRYKKRFFWNRLIKTFSPPQLTMTILRLNCLP